MRYEIIKDAMTDIDALVRTNDDGSITWIPMVDDNSDYQAYLNKDKAEQSTPIV
jgi:hypothetical protein